MDYSLTGGEAASVVVSAVGMYACLLLVLRVTGRRIVAAVSTYDLAAGIGLGAVFGRAVLGYTPTLSAGVLGMATLAGVHAATQQLRGTGDPGPLLLIRDGELQPEALRRARLDTDDLRVALRRASLGCWSEVGAMVLERSGTISVLRRGMPLDDALADVERRR